MTRFGRPSPLARTSLLLCGLLLLAAAIALGVLTWDWLGDQGSSVEEVRAELDAALPSGTEKAEVLAYLADKGYPYQETTADPNTDTLASRSGLTAGTPLVISSYSDRDGDRTMVLYFVLDEDNSMERIIVEERISSP